MFKKLLENIKNKFFFKEEIIGDYKLKNANFSKRFLAFFIDIIICFSLIISVLSFSLKNNKQFLNLNSRDSVAVKSFMENKENKFVVNKVVNTIFLVLFTYFFISTVYLKSTLGQKLFGLRIISIKNKNVTIYEILNKSLFISFIILISNTLIILFVFLLPLLITDFKITLLDIITNTVIIELKKIK